MDVTPIFKKKDPPIKKNYRPARLSHMPMIFEKIQSTQINNFMKIEVSAELCGFCENNSCQHNLMYMLEKSESSLDKEKYVGAVFMDHSNAFDTINHDLLIVK